MLDELHMHSSSLVKKVIIGFFCLIGLGLLALAAFYLFVVRAPSGVQYPVRINVESGQGAQSIAEELFANGLVRQPGFTQNMIVSRGGERSIQAGTYIFKHRMNVFDMAEKIASGDFGYVPVRLTVPEGTSSKRLAVLVNAKFPHIATSTFEALARSREGYLFPETYFFIPEATEQEIIDRMEAMFDRKISPLSDEIASSSKSLHEVLTIASILEGEVQTAEDRAMVADLIERRIKMGMPLQVDTTLVYVTGKTSATLTLKDLKMDSPYNTYVNKGLPPTPISNPGIDSILAVLNPIPNEYLFYLSDKDGITRFSKTHNEHVKLKQKYLK